MPVKPPTRAQIEDCWTGVVAGRVTREAAHEWAEPLMLAEYNRQPDMMVMTVLQHLHGFDMTFDPPRPTVLRHGPPGEYYRTLDEIADEYSRWRRNCEEFDRDPDRYRQRVRKRAVDMQAAERREP